MCPVTRRIVYQGSDPSDDLWLLDLPTGDRSVCWTLLNLVNVTAEELMEKFNTIQVCASFKKCEELFCTN